MAKIFPPTASTFSELNIRRFTTDRSPANAATTRSNRGSTAAAGVAGAPAAPAAPAAAGVAPRVRLAPARDGGRAVAVRLGAGALAVVRLGAPFFPRVMRPRPPVLPRESSPSVPARCRIYGADPAS